uniref:Uncharacterized protein n=1 Tax=Anguilla anguilla TaxID=7936 RepID=A0A0E9Q2H8_ANGAN
MGSHFKNKEQKLGFKGIFRHSFKAAETASF